MMESNFEGWLCKKLTSLDIDNDVYGSYITGILEDTEGDEEKAEALSEVLESVVENSQSLCDDLIMSWKTFHDDDCRRKDEPEKEINIEGIIAAHVGAATKKTQTKSISQTNQANAASTNAVKQSVIAMYSSVQDDEEDEPLETRRESGPTHRNTVDSALEIMKNTNAEKIAQAEKTERLKQKEESAKKKAQDKADRELQKIKKAERKDKEKKRTQKKERSR